MKEPLHITVSFQPVCILSLSFYQVQHRHTSRVTMYSRYLPFPASWREERVDCAQQLVVSDDAGTVVDGTDGLLLQNMQADTFWVAPASTCCIFCTFTPTCM